MATTHEVMNTRIVPIRSEAVASENGSRQRSEANTVSLWAEQDWEVHKNVIRIKYLEEDLTTNEVRLFMLNTYNFSRSKQQYERIFKKWVFKKKLKRKEYEAISQELNEKAFDKLNLEFIVCGKKLSHQKLKSRIARHTQPTLVSKWAQTASWRKPQDKLDVSSLERSSHHANVIVRPTLATDKHIRFASRLPWFDFCDSLLGLQIWSASSPFVELERTLSKSEVVRTDTGHISADYQHCSYLAHQILVTAVAKGLHADFNTHIWTTELRSFGIDPAQITRILLHLEPRVPLRGSDDFFESIKTIATGCMPAAALIAMTYLAYFNSDNSIHGLDNGKIREFADLLLKLHAIAALKSFAARGLFTAKAILDVLLEISCVDQNTDLLKSLVRGENSMDVNRNIHNTKYPYRYITTYLPLQIVIRNHIFMNRSNSRLSYPEDSVQKSVECIDILLEAGANVDGCTCGRNLRRELCSAAQVCWRCSPLQLAMMTSVASRLIKPLLEHGAHVCRCINITPMIEIDNDIQFHVVKMLLEKGAAATYVRSPIGNSFGIAHRDCWFPLQAAVGRKRSDIATLLLQYGARPDEFVHLEYEFKAWLRDKERQFNDPGIAVEFCFGKILSRCNWLSPLTLSLLYDMKLARMLLDLGAPVNECHYDWLIRWMGWSDFGETDNCLTSGPQQSYGEELLDRSQILDIPQDKFQTALAAAVSSNSTEMTRVILERGALTSNDYGEPPLNVAARLGNHDLVILLLDFGAQLDASYSIDQIIFESSRSESVYEDWSQRDIVLSPLAEASARDHVDIMTELISRGADVNQCSEYFGVSPLHAAAICGSYRAVNLLLTHPSVRDSHPGTRLCNSNFLAKLVWFELNELSKCNIGSTDTLAAYSLSVRDEQHQDDGVSDHRPRSNQHIAEALDYKLRHAIQFAKIPYLTTCFAKSSIMLSFVDYLFLKAFQTQNVEAARIVIEQGVGLNVETTSFLLESMKKLLDQRNFSELSPVWFEMLMFPQTWSPTVEQSLEVIRLLYSSAKQLSEHNRMTDCRRMLEVTRSHLSDCLRKCPKQSPKLCNILWCALELGELEAVYLLLDHGLDTKSLSQGLVLACRRGDEQLVSIFLDRCADFNATETRGYFSIPGTAFDIACAYGHLNIVKCLVLAGASVNGIFHYRGISPLVCACSRGHLDVATNLIAHGADINLSGHSLDQHWIYSTKAKRTPLQAACAHGHLSVIIMLINLNADVNAPAGDNSGVTALQAAAIRGYFFIAQILVGCGAKVAAAASSIYGRTAIDGAAEMNRLDMVSFLLDHYDGYESISVVCRRAAGYAWRWCHIVMVEMLKSYPGARSDEWEDEETWYVDSDSEDESETETEMSSSDCEMEPESAMSDFNYSDWLHDDAYE